MEKELNKEVGNIRMYEVYKTTTGLYVKEEICNEYGIGNKEDYKIIKNNPCLKVYESEIGFINQESNNKLVPIYISIFDLQLVLSFNVIVDKNHNNDLYVSNSLCKKNGIHSEASRVIDGTVHCKVTEADLDQIENHTRNDKVTLRRKYIEKEIDTDAEEAEYLFMYYLDLETNTSYIPRKILELCKKLDITIEGKPKIINDKNCYSITEEELKLFEKKSTYRGIERIIKPNQVEEAPLEDIIPYNDYLSTINYETEEVQEENNDINTNVEVESESTTESNGTTEEKNNENIYNEEDEEEEVHVVENMIVPENNYNNAFGNMEETNSKETEETSAEESEPSPMVEEQVVEEIPVTRVKRTLETIIVYRDRRTNKLFIPKKDATNIDRESKMIMNRLCYQTSIRDLEQIYNKKIIIVDVYPFSKEVYNVIVCNNNGKFFVPEHTLADLNIQVSLQHKIIVNKEIYVEITSSDLDTIKGKETKNLEINIELKHITPTKKRN